jgi:hypothetical protein
MDYTSVRGEVMHPYSVVGLSKQLMEKIATEKKLPGDSKCICDRMVICGEPVVHCAKCLNENHAQ